jgi:3-oxoacyl-(acyl-carrier-protein) synthase
VKGFDPRAVIDDRRLLKFANRAHAFALAAADQAFADAGIKPTPANAGRWGLSVGHRHAGMGVAGALDAGLAPARTRTSIPTAARERHRPRPDGVLPRQSTAGLALLGRRYGIRGYSTSVHTACASGGQAIGTAMKLIRRGTDRLRAGRRLRLDGQSGRARRLLPARRGVRGQRRGRSREPSVRRDAQRLRARRGRGIRRARALGARGRARARIYAELAGDGNSLSSYRITDSHPSGDGPIQAMRWALADADAAPGDVDYVNAHGTSTPMNDRSESAALHVVFGADVARVSVSSTKSTMGHLIAGAGAVEAAVCALAIQHGTLPVNANYQHPDPDCELNLVVGEARAQQVRVALSNSLGFGGSNSCLAFRHPDFDGGRR